MHLYPDVPNALVMEVDKLEADYLVYMGYAYVVYNVLHRVPLVPASNIAYELHRYRVDLNLPFLSSQP